MKNKYSFTGEQKITATLVDEDYLWICFYGVSNRCALYKSSKFNPNIKYWDVDISADEVTAIIDGTGYIYLSLDDSLYMGAIVNKTTPSTISYYSIPLGVTEKAIDLINDIDCVYFLTPGINSGTNSLIVKYNKSTGEFIEIIDLSKSGEIIENASKIDIDIDGNLWVVSELNSTPILTKVWYDSGWNFSSTVLA